MDIFPVKAPLGSAWAFWPYTGDQVAQLLLDDGNQGERRGDGRHHSRHRAVARP